MNSKFKTPIKWNPEIAYAVGLIATDGNLSTDNRHINFTSKDKALVISFCKCLNLDNKIGMKGNGNNKERRYYVVQFGSVVFYKFLVSLGLTKAKSKTIGKLKIPQIYFFDFLRGCIDGDGCITSSKHPESIQPQLRLRLCSASQNFLIWIKNMIKNKIHIESGWIYSNHKSMHILSYGKEDSVKILKKMYYTNVKHYLDRKYRIAKPFII